MRIIITEKSKLYLSFVILAIILTLLFIPLITKRTNDLPVISFEPLSCFESGSPIYTVIGIADENTSTKTLMLFGEICKGFGVEPTVFAGIEKLKNVMNVLSGIDGFVCDYGIICENTSGMTRSEFLKYLAFLNDDFYRIAGKHSLCCYINGANCVYSEDVLNSYGQYGISYSVCTGESSSLIKSGDILAVFLSEKDVCEFASIVSAGISEGLRPVPIKEYISEYESFAKS